jgi:hypothetical protein
MILRLLCIWLVFYSLLPSICRRTRRLFAPLTEYLAHRLRHSQSVYRPSVFGTWQDCENICPTVRPGKIGGRIEMIRRRGRRRKQLVDGIKEKRRYWELKEETLDRTMWRTCFAKGCGLVIRQTADRMAATITTELHSEWNTEWHKKTGTFEMRSGNHVQLAALRNRDLELQTTLPFSNHGSVERSTACFRH